MWIFLKNNTADVRLFSLTNGFETRIIDGQYPERKCAAIYSKRDLEKWFNLRAMRTSLRNITIDKNIAGRYYQELLCSSM